MHSVYEKFVWAAKKTWKNAQEIMSGRLFKPEQHQIQVGL